MYLNRHKQIRPLKKKANEFELTPLVESTEQPVQRICRIPTKVRESAGEGIRQMKEPGETSRQTIKESTDNSNPREASSDNIKVGKLEESLPRFGPLYSVDQPSVQATKDKAWEHVMKKSLEKEPSVDGEEIKEIYSKAIRKVEQEAKEIYAEKISGIGSNFRWMMIKDGCFFLQLALLILGSSEQLGYPSNDPIFGKKHNKKDVKKWIEAMFYVGNQIPLVVLKELINQKFFQDVITKGKWNPTPSGLCKKVLFEVLVLPALKRDQGLSLKERIMGRGNDLVDQQPSDLLHGLQNLVIGPAPLDLVSDEYEADDQIDLEANEEEVGDYERIFPTAIDNGEGTSPSEVGDRIRFLLNAIGFPNAVDDRKRIFPCATELKRAGIRIKKLKNGGARNIHFKSYYLWAYLYLPALPVDDNTEIIFRNLKTYETCQQLGKNRREVSSYLRVMSDIIQTTKDAKLLEKKGIIQGNSDDVEKLPGTLSRLSSEDIRLTNEFRILRRQIRDYSSPWIHYKGVVNLVVFLTLLQTLFALLAYFRPPKP
ncbi:hypothetical protein Pfo_026512 [Paulownia fortunei]|nr:hypothetical protein Pfo_026512 [Paulownia fortunei]